MAWMPQAPFGGDVGEHACAEQRPLRPLEHFNLVLGETRDSLNRPRAIGLNLKADF